MKKIIAILFAVAMVTNEAAAFKSFGHQTVAKLAEKHLTEQAKSEVKAILKSDITKHAMWLYSLRKQPVWASVQHWQYFTLDANGKSTTSCEKDGMVQLERAIEVLRNRKNESDSLVLAKLRTVIQLMGDMHCLSQIRIEGVEETKGFAFQQWNNVTGRGEKRTKRTWEGVWAHEYLNRHDVFSPQYYADDIEIFLGDKREEYEKGTPRFWVENVGEDVVRCLEVIYPGAEVKSEIINRYEDIHNRCMAKAGYRLAKLLNDIFN